MLANTVNNVNTVLDYVYGNHTAAYLYISWSYCTLELYKN